MRHRVDLQQFLSFHGAFCEGFLMITILLVPNDFRMPHPLSLEGMYRMEEWDVEARLFKRCLRLLSSIKVIEG